MPSPYSAADWYWLILSDTTHVFSSARASYVPTNDSAYQAWLHLGNRPTIIPSEEELFRDVLATQYPAGIPVSPLGRLMAYATEKETAGVWFQPASVDQPHLFSTAPDQQTRIGLARQLAQAGEWTDGSFFFDAAGVPVAFTSAEMLTFSAAAGGYFLACSNHAAGLMAAVQTDPTTDIAQGWPSQGTPPAPAPSPAPAPAPTPPAPTPAPTPSP